MVYSQFFMFSLKFLMFSADFLRISSKMVQKLRNQLQYHRHYYHDCAGIRIIDELYSFKNHDHESGKFVCLPQCRHDFTGRLNRWIQNVTRSCLHMICSESTEHDDFSWFWIEIRHSGRIEVRGSGKGPSRRLVFRDL